MNDAAAVYTKSEVAAIFRVSERTIERRVAAGLLPTVGLGGRAVRFPRAVIDRMRDEGEAA